MRGYVLYLEHRTVKSQEECPQICVCVCVCCMHARSIAVLFVCECVYVHTYVCMYIYVCMHVYALLVCVRMDA